MSEEISRSNLPIPDRTHIRATLYDAKSPDVSYPPIEPLRPPEGAPSVLVVLQIGLGEDAEDADHLISPEERYRIAMARQ